MDGDTSKFTWIDNNVNFPCSTQPNGTKSCSGGVTQPPPSNPPPSPPPPPPGSVPLPPSNLTASAASSSSIKLAWEASTSKDIINYNVVRNGTMITQTSTTSYTDKNLTSGTTYKYTVQAINKNGKTSSTSNTASATLTGGSSDTTAPSKPGKFDGKAVSKTQINLSWKASTDKGGSGLKGYNIYLKGSNTPLNKTPVTSLSFGITNLKSNTKYSFLIEAVDGAGNKSDRANKTIKTPK